MSFDTVKGKGLQLLAGVALVAMAVVCGGYLASLTRQAGGPSAAAPVVPQDSEEEPGMDTAAHGIHPPAEPDNGVPEAPMIAVAAMGCLQEPGMYRMPVGSRVKELIDKARGATPDADLSDINLAARLLDATTLTIPALPVRGIQDGKLVAKHGVGARAPNPPEYTRSGWRPPSEASPLPPSRGTEQEAAAQRDGPGGLIDLNRASSEQLETLPGIGPKTAEKIIAYRSQTPFRSIEDLRGINGIGDKKLDALRSFVTVK